MTTRAKPACCTEKHLNYLDNLRKSVMTNMWGASPYLVAEFGLSRQDTRDILLYWIDTFEERHPRTPT